MIFKGVAVGSISAVVATIIAVTIEARNVVAAARASGFHGEVGLGLSTLLREPKFVTVAVQLCLRVLSGPSIPFEKAKLPL
jgi:hypothetical protein